MWLKCNDDHRIALLEEPTCIDGYDKTKPSGFAVHGTTDGCNRISLFHLKLSCTKDTNMNGLSSKFPVGYDKNKKLLQ